MERLTNKREAVMLSIRPKWCEKIVSGEKTIEVRKTRPKMDTPFKCYIYETQGWWKRNGLRAFRLGGRVIGEFTCDRIDRLAPANEPYGIYDIDDDYVLQTCLENGALWDYGHGTPLYGWHISGLKIYNTPKELSEFRRACPNSWYCESCAMHRENNGTCGNESLQIKRAPQSWCYVEAAKEGEKA